MEEARMEDKEPRNPEWDKISKALFAKNPEASSDAFVQSVMKRLEAAESGPRIVRIPAQWLAPVMGIAAMLLLALLPSRGMLPFEIPAIGEENEGVISQLVFAGGSPETDDVIGYVMEEQ
jgi:hypothetical protein